MVGVLSQHKIKSDTVDSCYYLPVMGVRAVVSAVPRLVQIVISVNNFMFIISINYKFKQKSLKIANIKTQQSKILGQ